MRELDPWMDEALCRDADPDMFFPDKGGDARPAIQLCRRCPVEEECREYALRCEVNFGIWGGRTARQRHRERSHD